MAFRDELETNVGPFLDDDEEIHGIFSAQTTGAYWGFLALLVVLVCNSFRTVVATDRRILVLSNGRMRETKMKSVVGEFPRSTELGPATGLWHTTEALGEKMYIHTRFHQDVAQIDRRRSVPDRPISSPATPQR